MVDQTLIFSLPRCGSTTLMRALNHHKDIECAAEPFNSDAPRFGALGPVVDTASMDARLHVVWAKCNAAKHVWHPGGWPFAKGSDLNRCLLARPDQKVILLNRRNILQRLVSNQMSMQTRLWSLKHADDRRQVLGFNFQAIKKNAIKGQLKRERELIDENRRALVRGKAQFLEMSYEDIYAPVLTQTQRREALCRILTFMEKDTSPDAMDIAAIDRLLDPAVSKMNSRETYLLVPNIHDIERHLGSDRTGRLFK